MMPGQCGSGGCGTPENFFIKALYFPSLGCYVEIALAKVSATPCGFYGLWKTAADVAPESSLKSKDLMIMPGYKPCGQVMLCQSPPRGILKSKTQQSLSPGWSTNPLLGRADTTCIRSQPGHTWAFTKQPAWNFFSLFLHLAHGGLGLWLDS